MRYNVTVKTHSREEGVTREGNIIVVRTKEPPVDNRANAAVIRLLSEFLRVPRSHIRIVSGASSKNKVVEII